MSGIFQQDWFVWGVGLILGFQILVVILGELLYRADRRALPLTPILRVARNTVLPLLVAYIFADRILEVPEDAFALRALATAFYISAIYAGLLLFNVLVFQQAPEGTWRHRAPSLFQDLIRILLVVVGAAIVLAVVWEQNLGGLIAALGVGSIVLGLALQETLGNLMAGIALLFERPFTIGDWIEVGDEQGAVEEINWRSVHVRTRERNLLVFPNSVLGREAIINYARPTALQTLRLSFAFSLEDPPHAVKQTMVAVAESVDGVLADPPPRALIREVLDDRMRYEAFIAIDQPRQIPQIVDAYTSRLWYAARRNSLHLPLPAAYEIKTDAPLTAIPDVDVMAGLAEAQGFQSLGEDWLARLAERAQVQLYTDGETVIEQGEVADAVFVVAAGSLNATWAPADEVVAEISIGVHEVVGVTSVSRQQASHTRVFSAGDATLIRIPHDVVDDCVHANPRLAHEFARVGEVRAEALRRARAEFERDGDEPDDQLLPVNMRRPQDDAEEADAS
jgi:small-conductance mechanosensitive channel